MGSARFGAGIIERYSRGVHRAEEGGDKETFGKKKRLIAFFEIRFGRFAVAGLNCSFPLATVVDCTRFTVLSHFPFGALYYRH